MEWPPLGDTIHNRCRKQTEANEKRDLRGRGRTCGDRGSTGSTPKQEKQQESEKVTQHPARRR
jgi:hypothetical protein